MEFEYLLKGAILGFSIAAPVGPIGILCIRKTLQYGRWSGLFSGLGASVADTIYGVIAAFGLTLISNFLVEQQFWLRLIGGFFLLYLGAKTFFAHPTQKELAQVSHKNLFSDFISTFFLTLSNPMTILSYLAIFAGLGFSNTEGNYANASWLVVGVFLGSLLWWVILETVHELRLRRFSGLFWPIFDSICRGHIRKLISPLQIESKIGSKEPEKRQKLSLWTVS